MKNKQRCISQKGNKINQFIAFTLAEVIIVIGIIGIVAEMTIPDLVQSFQKQVYIVSLKKAYTQFNQVLMQLAADYNCVGDLKCTGLFDASVTNQTLGDAIVKYFKVSKNCQLTTDVCFSTSLSNYFDGSGARYSANVAADYRFIELDGSSYRITSYQTNCAMDASMGSKDYMTQACALVIIDVNGPYNGPNNYGRDIFGFHITNGKGPMLYPFGGSDVHIDSKWNSAWSGCGSSDTGYGAGYSYNYGFNCAGRVLEEGWRMNY